MAFCFAVLRDADLTLALSAEDALATQADGWLDLSALNEVVAYDVADLVVTVQAGLTVGELTRQLRLQGHALSGYLPPNEPIGRAVLQQLPALEAGFRRGLKESVLGLQVVDGRGRHTKCGGKVVKNVTGYDLNRFYVGSEGVLVMPTEVTLRLTAAPATQRQGWLVLPTTEALQSLSRQLLAAPSATLAQWELLPVFQPHQWPPSFSQHLPQAKVGQWLAWVQFAGREDLMEPAWDAFQLLVPQGAAWHAVDYPTGVARAQQQLFLPDPFWSLVLDVALPLGEWPGIWQLLNDALAPHWCQIRPAAGWLRLAWGASSPTEQALEQSIALVRQQGGEVKLLRMPPETIPGSGYSRWNLPQQPALLHLNQKLKAVFDPANMLRSPRLPLRPLTDPAFEQLMAQAVDEVQTIL